jgi:hypothetical protein
MKIYFDNVIASGMIRGDLSPQEEMKAVQQLELFSKRGVLEIVTSRESWREQEGTQILATRVRLEQARGSIPVVHDDLRLLGFQYQQDHLGGSVCNPLATDIIDKVLFDQLTTTGLEPADTRHLMYAIVNRCDWFITLDRDFDDRGILEPLCRGLRIVKPTEMVAELLAG